jgi:WD40 repeat protein
VLVFTGDDKKVNVWRVGSPSSVWSLAGNSAAVECVCFDEEETTVASGSRGGAVKVWAYALCFHSFLTNISCLR